ncbi:MAG: hypothetical protein DRO11_03100, partial [Methanobacteriota archaeon]
MEKRLATIYEKHRLDKQEYFKRFGWRKHPLLQLELPAPECFVYREEDPDLPLLLDYISEGEGVVIVYGPAGYGKTTLLKLLAWETPGLFPTTMVTPIEDPGIDPETLLKKILDGLGVETRVGEPAKLLSMVVDQLTRRGKKLVLLVDNLGQIPSETMEFVASLVESGAVAVLAGLASEVGRCLEKVPSLGQRKGVEYEVKPMKQGEIGELLARRLAWARGDYSSLPTDPFSSDAIGEIHRASGGSPREALLIAREVLDWAITRRVHTITGGLVRSSPRVQRVTPVPGPAVDLERFSPTQREIIRLLRDAPSGLYTRQIYEGLGRGYDSIKSPLKRLRDGGVVEVVGRKGKSYKYALNREFLRRLREE